MSGGDSGDRPEMIVYKGLPVPWVVRWTSEIDIPGPRLLTEATDRGTRLTFSGEVPSDRIDGLLYLREGDSRGIGEPVWKQMHTRRQRLCQVEGRCQVCGDRIDPPIPWMLPKKSMVARHGSKLITDVPPTCVACLPIAMNLCPHLGQKAPRLIDVSGYRVHGVFGDLVDINAKGRNDHYQGDRRMDAYLDNMMARLTIVEIWDHRKRRP